MPTSNTMLTEGTPTQMPPRYPVYVPTKGRHDDPRTIKFLLRDGVPFRVVVEPQEAEAYAKVCGEERLLVLPFSNLGQGSIPARKWIMEHSIEEGHARHWQLDDNIRYMRRTWLGERIPCDSGVALRVCEDFSDRYENVAISGLAYQFFVTYETKVPYYLNTHVYSCCLFNNSIPHRWRGRYNEDTDMCLQVLADGWCTVQLNVFTQDKATTMTMKGGNTDQLYQGDGRLKMARALERAWPGVVRVDRRFGRPQHVIDWTKFDTPLRRKADLDLSRLPRVDEYGMELTELREPTPTMRRVSREWRRRRESERAQAADHA